MKAHELAKLLLAGPNLRVITNGYEGGYEDIGELDHFEIVLNVYKEWYYGPHEGASCYYGEQKEHEMAIHLTAALPPKTE